VKPVQRSLFVTLRMMRSEGLQISGRFAGGKLYLFVARPDAGKGTLSAKFDSEELAAAAARWLETMVLRHHPRSAYAQLRRAIASSASRR
jgi:hypothetical protein